jgi:DNA repair exonuclease SbcCD ATPase subunit
MEELKKLGTEQERANRAEREMSGFYVTLNSQIESGRLDEASDTIKSIREFLNAPLLRGIRVFEARKQTHLAAIDAMEKVMAFSSGGVVIQNTAQEEMLSELEARNTALERLLAAFTAEGADQNKIIAEYSSALSQLESSNARLESSNADQQDTINKRDSEIRTLRTEITQREQRETDLNSSMAVLQAQYDDLSRRMEAAIRAFNGE